MCASLRTQAKTNQEKEAKRAAMFSAFGYAILDDDDGDMEPGQQVHINNDWTPDNLKTIYTRSAKLFKNRLDIEWFGKTLGNVKAAISSDEQLQCRFMRMLVEYGSIVTNVCQADDRESLRLPPLDLTSMDGILPPVPPRRPNGASSRAPRPALGVPLSNGGGGGGGGGSN